MKILAIVLLCVFINACADKGRYTHRNDSKPDYISADINFKDVEPKFEVYLAATMRPYTVLGKHYTPLKTGKGYTSTGIASWYGKKFHGHNTANGEIYNMFAMSAAHKTLPLPSIVRVTNLQNGRQAIVRVNDRGPFHQDRVIDLSYAAAMKLGVLDTGTAKVKVDVMHVDQNGLLTVGKQKAAIPAQAPTNNQLYIQVAALSDWTKAQSLARNLRIQYKIDVATPSNDGLIRLQMGPIEENNQVNELLKKLKKDGFEQAFTLLAPP